MKTVKVNKAELLEKVQSNRDAHVAEYEQAMIVYRQKAVAALKDAAEKAETGGEIKLRFELVEPVSQVKEYDRAIAMLTMSVDNEIELGQVEFNQFVMDDWQWSAATKFANSRYLD